MPLRAQGERRSQFRVEENLFWWRTRAQPVRIHIRAPSTCRRWNRGISPNRRKFRRAPTFRISMVEAGCKVGLAAASDLDLPSPTFRIWVGRPNDVKLHGSALHAMSWAGADAVMTHQFSRKSKAHDRRLGVYCTQFDPPALDPPFAACNTASQ